MVRLSWQIAAEIRRARNLGRSKFVISFWRSVRLLAFLGAFLPVQIQAEQYDVIIFDLSIADSLDRIGSDIGVEFTGHRTTRRRINSERFSGTRDEIVDQVAATLDLDAFLFNGQVHLSPAEERAVRLIRLGDVSARAARAALDAAGLVIPSFDISEVADGGALVLSGPIEYLAISESIIATLEPEEEFVAPQVKVRRGNRLDADRVEVRTVAEDLE